MTALPEAKLYIDGVVRRATNDKTYDNIGPWTGEPVGKAADASKEDVNAAIVAAAKRSIRPIGRASMPIASS